MLPVLMLSSHSLNQMRRKEIWAGINTSILYISEFELNHCLGSEKLRSVWWRIPLRKECSMLVPTMRAVIRLLRSMSIAYCELKTDQCVIGFQSPLSAEIPIPHPAINHFRAISSGVRLGYHVERPPEGVAKHLRRVISFISGTLCQR